MVRCKSGFLDVQGTSVRLLNGYWIETLLERAGTYLAISYRGSGVFMVEGTFGRERRADIGVKERKGKEREKDREQRMAWKGEKRGERGRGGAGTCKRTGCISDHTRIV